MIYMLEFFDDYVQDFIRAHPMIFYLIIGMVVFLLVLVVDILFLNHMVTDMITQIGRTIVDWFSAPLTWSYDKFAAYVEGWSK